MNDLEAKLTRAFAEAPQPADNGFTQGVARAVERRARLSKLQTAVDVVGLAGLGAVVLYVAYAGVKALLGAPLLAVGAWAARTLQGVPLGASLGDVLIILLSQAPLLIAALASGFVVYRVVER